MSAGAGPALRFTTLNGGDGMSEKQKNALYAVLTIVVLIILLQPFGNLGWEEVKRLAVLLFFALAVGGVVWRVLQKKKY